MKNRINPGIPPSRRNERRSQRSEGKSPLDLVARVSLPMQALLAQVRRADSSDDKGAIYDLSAIYVAARADPGLPGDAIMPPELFAVEEEDAITAWDDDDPNHMMADSHAAFSYVSHIDPRVQSALGKHMAEKQHDAVQADPVQAGVDACKGGPFGLMFAALKATAATGQSPQDYFVAVLERAKEQARGMDDIEAESLVARVQGAIEGCPDLRTMTMDGADPGEE